MKSQKSATIILMAAFAVALISHTGQAQRLYNKERDDQAQAALPLAQALKTGELFDKQLKNLASLAKKDFETEFFVTRFQINAFTLNLLTWENVHNQVCEVEALNSVEGIGPKPAEIDAALAELKASIGTAKESLEAFKKSIKAKGEKNEGEEEKEDTSVLATLFNSLGDLDSLNDFAEQVGKAHPKLVNAKTLEGLKQLQDITTTLKKVYDAYTEKVDGFNKLGDQLGELRLVLKKVAIQSLQVDEEHWKNIASIRARRENERADVLALVSQYKGIVSRLNLVDYPPLDPAKKDSTFCTVAQNAVNTVDGLDIRPHQMITEHLNEILALAQSMEKDNRRIEDEARMALKKMNAASSESDRRAAAELTLAALSEAINNIKTADPIHKDLKKMSDLLDTERGNLEGGIKNSTPASLNALRSTIITARKNDVDIRNMVGDIPQMLFIVAALIARGSTPTKLAEIRFAQELHAFSIRKSAVRARAYELTVSTGAQRLALFHQGGIKPTDVAELVFAASNIAITPAILAR
jgi:tetratricopeptide (TPR) repeat protein